MRNKNVRCEPIEGSKYWRVWCWKCGESMRVSEKNIRPYLMCDGCDQPKLYRSRLEEMLNPEQLASKERIYESQGRF